MPPKIFSPLGNFLIRLISGKEYVCKLLCSNLNYMSIYFSDIRKNIGHFFSMKKRMSYCPRELYNKDECIRHTVTNAIFTNINHFLVGRVSIMPRYLFFSKKYYDPKTILSFTPPFHRIFWLF